MDMQTKITERVKLHFYISLFDIFFCAWLFCWT